MKGWSLKKRPTFFNLNQMIETILHFIGLCPNSNSHFDLLNFFMIEGMEGAIVRFRYLGLIFKKETNEKQ